MSTTATLRNGGLNKALLSIIGTLAVAAIIGMAGIWKGAMTRAEVHQEIRTLAPLAVKPELDGIKDKVDIIHDEQIRQAADLKHLNQNIELLLKQP